jgi:hypothetical protein
MWTGRGEGGDKGGVDDTRNKQLGIIFHPPVCRSVQYVHRRTNLRVRDNKVEKMFLERGKKDGPLKSHIFCEPVFQTHCGFNF